MIVAYFPRHVLREVQFAAFAGMTIFFSSETRIYGNANIRYNSSANDRFKFKANANRGVGRNIVFSRVAAAGDFAASGVADAAGGAVFAGISQVAGGSGRFFADDENARNRMRNHAAAGAQIRF